MDWLMDFITRLDGWVWSDWVLVSALVTGVVFTFFSGFSQYRSLTHGTATVLGKYSQDGGDGAISHFQALSAALSATVGLGNIAGVAMAVILGGPGAIFWMWVVGLFGMVIKFTEVTLSMIYRNTDDPDNPHGGPMWVLKNAISENLPSRWGRFLGYVLGGLFCVALIIAALTAGNLFQAFNVANVTVDVAQEFGFDNKATITWVVAVALALLVGAVILGGIKRIGMVAGAIVPFMCAVYIICGLIIVFTNIADVPALFALIIDSAFNEQTAVNAFVGGGLAGAFTFGMQRALFSSEAGFGSSPIAHAAVKTNEPVREGIVAGLEPFIDTLVICTITALVVLLSGVWNRTADFPSVQAPEPVIAPAYATVNPIIFDDPSSYPELGVGQIVYAQLTAEESEKTETVTNAAKSTYFIRGEVALTPAGRVLQWDRLQIAASNTGNKTISAGSDVTLASGDLLLSANADNKWKSASPEISLAINNAPTWQLPNTYLNANGELPSAGDGVFWVVADSANDSGRGLWFGQTNKAESGNVILWDTMPVTSLNATSPPQIIEGGLYKKIVGAAATRHAFDEMLPGVGGWVVSLAVLLFALSTMISWSYYGEQGIVFLAQGRLLKPLTNVFILVYKLVFCAVIVWSCVSFDPSNKELNTISNVGVGLMLTINIPIILMFGMTAIRHYHGYTARLKRGDFKAKLNR